MQCSFGMASHAYNSMNVMVTCHKQLPIYGTQTRAGASCSGPLKSYIAERVHQGSCTTDRGTPNAFSISQQLSILNRQTLSAGECFDVGALLLSVPGFEEASPKTSFNGCSGHSGGRRRGQKGCHRWKLCSRAGRSQQVHR